MQTLLTVDWASSFRDYHVCAYVSWYGTWPLNVCLPGRHLMPTRNGDNVPNSVIVFSNSILWRSLVFTRSFRASSESKRARLRLSISDSRFLLVSCSRVINFSVIKVMFGDSITREISQRWKVGRGLFVTSDITNSQNRSHPPTRTPRTHLNTYLPTHRHTPTHPYSHMYPPILTHTHP